MEKILLSAFACDPAHGSELSYGWNWAIELAGQGYEVHCLTREIGKPNIDLFKKPENLFFHYINLPYGLEALYSRSQATMYVHYIAWQWLAYKKAKALNKSIDFKLAHHVTWGSLQMGSFLYKLGIPLIFGPAGGGQVAPVAFKSYFLNHWKSEVKRQKVSNLLTKWNPGFKKMIKMARVVLVSNSDTYDLATSHGAKNANLFLDVGLPNSFFPEIISIKNSASPKFRLLWVGRFLPRKGLLLILDVMEKLKDYPEIELTVVGDGEMKDAFVKAVERLKLSEQVKWVGKVPFEEIKNYYASHHLFFFTSLRDSGGVQLLEAMAYGLPIVTLDLHGSGMIVGTDRGIKVKAKDPNEAIQCLSEAILTLFKDRDKLNQLSQGAYAYSRKFTWEKITKTIVKKYYH